MPQCHVRYGRSVARNLWQSYDVRLMASQDDVSKADCWSARSRLLIWLEDNSLSFVHDKVSDPRCRPAGQHALEAAYSVYRGSSSLLRCSAGRR